MALLIDQRCINCDMCLAECPNQAISEGPKIYEIDPNRCTECVGHYAKPTCVSVCPIDCIAVNPEHIESPSMLLEKYHKVTGKKPI